MFTDNDELAGLTAYMIKAEKFIILSNIDGLYSGEPLDPNSKLIHSIGLNDTVASQFISGSKSSFGRGGMTTKFSIATKAAKQGIETIIANGKQEDIILDILKNKVVGTRFLTTELVTS